MNCKSSLDILNMHSLIRYYNLQIFSMISHESPLHCVPSDAPETSLSLTRGEGVLETPAVACYVLPHVTAHRGKKDQEIKRGYSRDLGWTVVLGNRDHGVPTTWYLFVEENGEGTVAGCGRQVARLVTKGTKHS